MRVRGLWDVAALPRADIAKVAEQKGVLLFQYVYRFETLVLTS